jgi:hypothetical protein
MPFALPGTTRFLAGARKDKGGIATCPWPIAFRAVSSRSAPAVISTNGRELKQGLGRAPAMEIRDSSLRFKIVKEFSYILEEV